MFELHTRLEQDCFHVGDFEVSRLLLMNDSRYPWFVLVPMRVGVTEIFQLSEGDQQQLIRESSRLAERLMASFQPDKLNIAAIGNLVPQLHVHHVVRYTSDSAWPAPVWGRLPALPYASAELDTVLARLDAGSLGCRQGVR